MTSLVSGGGSAGDDELDNRPKHSVGISCRPREACAALESEERQKQFKYGVTDF